MQKSFCDLCGKELTGDTFGLRLNTIENITDHYSGASRDVYTTHQYELCRECAEKIYQYVQTLKTV